MSTSTFAGVGDMKKLSVLAAVVFLGIAVGSAYAQDYTITPIATTFDGDFFSFTGLQRAGAFAYAPLINDNGSIVSISSELGAFADDVGCYVPSYRISKAAINMFVKNLSDAHETKGRGIKVFSFDPGWVKTDMGGEGAQRAPEEPADEIFNLAVSKKQSGLFYSGLEKRNW